MMSFENSFKFDRRIRISNFIDFITMDQFLLHTAFAIITTYITMVLIQCVFILASMMTHDLEEKRLEMTYQSIHTQTDTAMKPKFKMTDEAKVKQMEEMERRKMDRRKKAQQRKPKGGGRPIPASIVAKVKADSEKRRADNMKEMLEKAKNYS
jgi:hypothetical protein